MLDCDAEDSNFANENLKITLFILRFFKV